jgi:hypothetical protein
MDLIDFDEVRDEMVSEIETDIETGALYLSDRLNIKGKELFPKLLIQTAKVNYLDEMVVALGMEFFNTTHPRKTQNGITQVKMPSNANLALCEGELNRYYIRGVCRKAISRNQELVVVYRARPSTSPRPESNDLIGKTIKAIDLLEDLRKHPGEDTELGIPSGPNSGISVKLIR